MKAMAAAFPVLLILLTAPAHAIPTLDVTSGFFASSDPFQDIAYDFKGDGFEIGPAFAPSAYAYGPNGPACCGRAI